MIKSKLIKKIFLHLLKVKWVFSTAQSIGPLLLAILVNLEEGHCMRIKIPLVLLLTRHLINLVCFAKIHHSHAPKPSQKISFSESLILKIQDLNRTTLKNNLFSRVQEALSLWDKIDQILKNKDKSQVLDNTTWSKINK